MIKLESFPPELRRAIRALANANREQIFLAMTSEGTSYTQLLRSTKLRKGSLTHHLKALISAGLVRNFSKRNLDSSYASFYSPTDFGLTLVSSIFDKVQPPSQSGTVVQPTVPPQRSGMSEPTSISRWGPAYPVLMTKTEDERLLELTSELYKLAKETDSYLRTRIMSRSRLTRREHLAIEEEEHLS
jgi:DNA-binding transcriptional ArsR family regulator